MSEDDNGFRRAKRPIYYYDEGLEVLRPKETTVITFVTPIILLQVKAFVMFRFIFHFPLFLFDSENRRLVRR